MMNVHHNYTKKSLFISLALYAALSFILCLKQDI